MPFAEGPSLRYLFRGQYEHEVRCVYAGSRDVITINPGERTDLASTPRIVWWFLPPTGAYEKAATIHDKLCRDCQAAHDEGRAPVMSPRDVDGMFLRILREEHEHAVEVGDDLGRIPAWKRRVLWIGVRWGALFNPARRTGWWRDAPAVVGATALVAVLLLLAVYWADRGAHALADLIPGS